MFYDSTNVQIGSIAQLVSVGSLHETKSVWEDREKRGSESGPVGRSF